MAQKFSLEGIEYDVNKLNKMARMSLSKIEFIIARMEELSNFHSVLQNSKNSYIESMKKEIISKKSGFLLEED